MKKIVHQPGIVEFQDFFSKEECENTLKFFEENSELWQETCFFNARVISPDEAVDSGKSNLYDIAHFWDVRERFKAAAEEVFGREVKNLALSGHKWQTGAFASMHSDNHDHEGNPQPGWFENKLVTIVYLNESYEGGELVFQNFPVRIAPKQGTLIVFNVDYEHTHGVTEVTSGDRITMMSSFDFADSVYDDAYYEAKNKELELAEKHHEEQHRVWRETGQAEQEPFR